MIASKKALRDNEPLWEACKKEVVQKLGKFSARAMQQAIVLYKKHGGGYLGTKSPNNALAQWAKKNTLPDVADER